jgi:hypothetical protein
MDGKNQRLTAAVGHVQRAVSRFAAYSLGAVVGISHLSCTRNLETVTVNERVFSRNGDSLQFNGGRCKTLQLGSSRSFEPRPLEGSDFEVTEGEEADGMVVQVFSDAELLISRRYDEATLRSGAVDEFTVTTHAGRVYVLRYWDGRCAPLDVTSRLIPRADSHTGSARRERVVSPTRPRA